MEKNTFNLHDNNPRGLVVNTPNNVAELLNEGPNGPSAIYGQFTTVIVDNYREAINNTFKLKTGLNADEIIKFGKFLKGANYTISDSNTVSHGTLRAAQSYLIFRLIKKLPKTGRILVLGCTVQEAIQLKLALPNVRFQFHVGTDSFRDNERMSKNLARCDEIIAKGTNAIKMNIARDFLNAYNQTTLVRNAGCFTICPDYSQIPGLVYPMAVSIDSLYDSTTVQITDLMKKHNIKRILSIRHVAYELKHTDTILNPVLGYEWRSSGDTVAMIFPDQSPGYTHDKKKIIELSKDSSRNTGSFGSLVLSSAVEWKSCGYGLFSLTLEFKPKSLVRQYLTCSDQEVIYICSLPTLWKSGRVKLYPVTKAKYIALLNFVMSTETDAKKLVGYLRSSLSAFSIGAVLVDERWDLYSVDAYDIIIFAITHGIAQRSSIIDVIKKIGDYVKTGEFRDDPAWVKIIRFITDMLEKIAIWLGIRGKPIIQLFHEFMQTGVSKVSIKKYWFAESMHFSDKRFNVPFNYQNAVRLLRNLALNDGYGGPNSFARMSELLFGPQVNVDNTTNHASSKLSTIFNPNPNTIGVLFGVAPGGMAIDLSEKCKIYTVIPSTSYPGYEPLKDKRLYSQAINCLKYNTRADFTNPNFYPWPKEFTEKYSIDALKMRVKGEALNTKPDWFVSDVGSASDHSDTQLGLMIDSINAFEITKINFGIIKIHASLNRFVFDGERFHFLFEDLLSRFKLKILRTDVFNPLSYEYYLQLQRRLVPLKGPAVKLKLFNLKRKALKMVYKPVYSNWLRMEMWYNDHVASTCADLVGIIPPPIGPFEPPPPPALPPPSPPVSGSESDDSTTESSSSDESSNVTISVNGVASEDSTAAIDSSESEFDLCELDFDGEIPVKSTVEAVQPVEPISDVKEGKQEESSKKFWPEQEVKDDKPKFEENPTYDGKTDSSDDQLIPRPVVESDKEEVKEPVQPVKPVQIYKGYEPERKMKAADVTKITLESTEVKTFREDAASEAINVEKGKYTKFSPARTGVIDQQLNVTSRAVTEMYHDPLLAKLAEDMGYYYVPIAPYGMCFYNALALLLAGTQWLSSMPNFQKLFLMPDLVDKVRWIKGNNTPKGNLNTMNTPTEEAFAVLAGLKVDAICLDRNLNETYRTPNWNAAVRWGFIVLYEKEIDGEFHKHADVFLNTVADPTKNMALHPNIRKPDNLRFPKTYRTIDYCKESALTQVAQAFITWIQSDSNLIQVNDLLKKMSITSFRFKIPLRFVHGPPGAGKTYLIAKYLFSLPEHLRKTILYCTPRRKVRDEIAECLGNMAGIRDTIQAIAWADKHFAIKTYLKVFKLIDPKEKPMVIRSAVTEVMVDEYTLVPGLIIFGLAGLFPEASFTCIGDPFQTKLDLSAFPELKTGAVPITAGFQLKDLITNSDFVTFSTSTYRFSSFGLKLARIAYRKNRFKPEIYAVDDRPFIIRFLKPEERFAFSTTGGRYAQLVDSIQYLSTLPDVNYMTIAASQGMSVDTVNLWLGPNTLDNLDTFQDTAYVGLTRAKHHFNVMCHSKMDLQRLESQWLSELHRAQCPNSFIGNKVGGTIGGMPNKDVFNKKDFTYDYAKEWAMRGYYVPDDEVKIDKTRVVRQKHVADPRRFDPFFLKNLAEVPEHIDNSREVMFNRAVESIKAVIFKERLNKIERETKKLSLFAFGKVHYAADSIASVNTFIQRSREHLVRSGYKKKVLSKANFLRAVKTLTDIFHSTFIDNDKYERIKNKVVVDQIVLKAWAEFCAAAKFTEGNAELTWHEIRWRLSGFIKQQIKPKGKESGYENKGGQPVVQGEKAFNICFSLMFRVFKAISSACFKDEFKYATKMTEEEQYAHYIKYKKAYPDSWDDMADCTQYDATMDERTDLCEAARWKLFDPFDHNLEVYYWLKRNRPVYLKEMVYGIAEARGSGQPDTEAGNTNTNMGYNASMLNGEAIKKAQDKGLYVPLRVTDNPKNEPDFSWGPLGTMVTLSSYFDHNMMLAGLFIGDDCLIIIKRHAVFNMWFYQIIFMTKLKLDIRRNSSEFCNHIFSIHGFCYNPHKLVEKLMNKDFIAVLASKEKWYEFSDGLYMTVNRYLANPEGANKACSDFFGKPVEYYDELWRQLDAFCQLSYEAIQKMPFYDVILRSDTYGGKVSSKTTELTNIINVVEINAITEMSNSNVPNKKRDGPKKLRKDLKIAEGAIKSAEKEIPKVTGTPGPQRTRNPRKDGYRRKNPGAPPSNRPSGGVRSVPVKIGKMEMFEPNLKKFLEGEMKAKEVLNSDTLKTVKIMSAPAEASYDRMGSRNAKPVNQKNFKLVLNEPVQDSDKINRYILFKDAFRSLVHWYKDSSATAMKYNAAGSIPYSEVADPVASEEFVFTASSTDNGWHFPQIKQLNWKAGDPCHGSVLFPGISHGRCYLYKGPTDKIVMTITSNPGLESYIVRPMAHINGSTVEKQSVTISAIGDNTVVAASLPEGYYTIDFAKSGGTTNTLKFNLSIVGTVGGSRWAHRCTPGVVRNLPFVGESRTTCASIKVSNFTPNIDLAGSVVAMQPAEKDSWLDHATLTPDEFYNRIASSANALTPVSFKKGFYGFVKPVNIKEYEFKNSVDQNGADVNYAGFDLEDDTPYILVATKVEDDTSQVYAVTVALRFEFTTDVDGELPEFPRFSVESLEQAIQTIRPVPQWGENPSHLKKIWGEIQKIGVFAYKAYRLAQPIFQVAETLLA